MTDEIDNLCRFLDEQRAVLRHKAGDLDATQLQRTLPPSDLTLGGMVNHLAFVEDWWFRRTLQDDQDAYWAAVDWDADRDWEWHSAADDDPDRLWARYDAAVTRA
ncbi:MAG TPA: mini-circle protein, partial [Nocardioides bacterium]|nr:mini-circle protein [Nocardioides sp.]